MQERQISLRPILYFLENEALKNIYPKSVTPLCSKAYIRGLFRVFSKFRILLNANYLEKINKIETLLGSPEEELKKGEIRELKEEIEFLLSLNPIVEERGFILTFSDILKEIDKALEKGQKGIGDAYFLYGTLAGLNVLSYCHEIDVFRSLVHHLQVYAESWPATFALQEIKGDLEFLLKEYRVLER